MDFEWDEAKSEETRARRGFGFELVREFDWEQAVILEDKRQNYGEARYRAFGFAGTQRVFVAFTIRGSLRRIISVRSCMKRRRGDMASRKLEPYAPDEHTQPLTDEEIKRLRPAKEVFAELGIPMPRTRGRPPVDTPKRQVTLRLDETVVQHFKRGGKGWQTRINDTLAEAIKAGK